MRLARTFGLVAAAAAATLLIAACGGGDDSSDSQTNIRTNKGLAVAAIGAGFDPRLQAADDTAENDNGTGAEPAPAQDSIGRNAAIGQDTPYGSGYFPSVQQSNNGITVQGYGNASADADSAVVEFYFYANGGGGVEPQPAPDTSSRSSGGSSGSSSSGMGIAEPAAPDADLQQQEVAPITEATLQPVIDALVGAGVPREDIEFIGQSYYDKFSASATLRVTVDNLDILDPAVQAATNAAAGLGTVQLSSTNVGYTVADCTALEKAAMQVAVEDANDRAAAFAQTLSVGLGNIIGASHYSYSPYGGSACGESVGGPIPLAQATYAAGGSRVVEVFANVSVTYAIA